MKKILIFLSILLFSFLGVGCFFNANEEEKANRFEEIYLEHSDDELHDIEWIKLSSDNRTLTFDSDPNDNLPINNFVYYDKMMLVIEIICEEYNVPSYIHESIGDTAPIDGMRKYENEQLIMQWQFDYTTGMVVIFELKN